MKIVFMGTPDFAVPCLQRLIDEGYDIACVLTQPDRPVGRKQVLTPPPVKELALKYGLEVYQPDTLKCDEAYNKLADYSADYFVVAAYGKILPKRILDLPKYACINVHGSILPKYRGAAPIQWSVINGEREVGITTMLMGEGLDTGDILLIKKTELLPDETAGELFDRLSNMSPDLLIETLEQYKEGNIVPLPQNEAEATYAPMLNKEMSFIDFNASALAVHNKIRGLSPWPLAQCDIGNTRFKVFKSRVVNQKIDAPVGEAFVFEGEIALTCGDGNLIILEEIRPDGGKKMKSKDYLRGHSI